MPGLRDEPEPAPSYCTGTGFVLAVVGIGLFAFGVYVLVLSGQSQQGMTIGQFENVVTAWKDNFQTEFASLSVRVDVDATAATAALSTVTQKDNFNDPAAEAMDYPAIYYRLTPTSTLLAVQNFSTALAADLTVVISTPGGATSSVPLDDVALFRQRNVSALSKQRSTCESLLFGIFDEQSSHCRVYERLSRVCLQVELVGGTWTAAAVPAAGCFYDGVQWSLSEYENVGSSVAAVQRVAAGQSAVTFADFSITVRSKHDPYLAAEQLTESTMDFGLTAGELVGLGIGLLVVAVILLAFPVGYAVKQYLDARNKRRVAVGGEYHA